MTPREIALSICEPWFNGDPCDGCECHKVCTKLVERIETVIQSERDWLEAKAQSYKNFALALQSDVPETNFGNMAQSVDCYGDGNVYRGQRSRDSETKTITFSKVETVEPVGEIVLQDTKYHGWAMAVKPSEKTGVLPEGTKLYTAPPKREPLTDAEICEIFISHGRDKETFSRAIERAHGIGGEE